MVQVLVQELAQGQDQVQVQARVLVLVHRPREEEVVVVLRRAHLQGHTLDQELVLDLEIEEGPVVVDMEVDRVVGMVEEMVATKSMHACHISLVKKNSLPQENIK